MKNNALNPARSDLRNFGLLMFAAFTAIGCLRWWLKGNVPSILFGIAVTFLILGLAVPGLLKPVYRAWMQFALALNWVMTRVLLTIAFYGMITPAAIIYRVISGDPLKRKWDSTATTYWEAPDDQPREIEAYRNQF